MYIVANRIHLAKEWREAFETRFRKRASQIEKQPGFVRMEVLKPDQPDAPYQVLTTWEDKAAFDAWIGSEDFRVAHADPLPKEAFVDASTLERFEALIAVEKAFG